MAHNKPYKAGWIGNKRLHAQRTVHVIIIIIYLIEKTVEIIISNTKL